MSIQGVFHAWQKDTHDLSSPSFPTFGLHQGAVFALVRAYEMHRDAFTRNERRSRDPATVSARCKSATPAAAAASSPAIPPEGPRGAIEGKATSASGHRADVFRCVSSNLGHWHVVLQIKRHSRHRMVI